MFEKESQIVKAFKIVLPHLGEITGDDIMTSITDKEKFLAYFPGEKMRMDIKPGDKIPVEDPLMTTIRENRTIASVVPENVYGTPFKAVTFPLKDSKGKCIGAIGYAKTLERDYKIDNLIKGMGEGIDKTNNAIDYISKCVSEISEKAESNAASVEETLAGIQEVTANAQMIDKIAIETRKLSSEVLTSSEKGEEAVKQVADSVNTILESSKDVVSLIQTLSDSAKKIEDILGFINEISEQTNLLALNAAIEAARAGDYGKGFSVVAEEVRKLAEQSKQSTVDIADLLNTISENTQKVTTAVEKSYNKVSEGVNYANETYESILNIHSGIDNVYKRIEDISYKTRLQVTNADQISKVTENVAQVVSDTSLNVKQVTEALHEQFESLSQISSRNYAAMELIKK